MYVIRESQEHYRNVELHLYRKAFVKSRDRGFQFLKIDQNKTLRLTCFFIWTCCRLLSSLSFSLCQSFVTAKSPNFPRFLISSFISTFPKIVVAYAERAKQTVRRAGKDPHQSGMISGVLKISLSCTRISESVILVIVIKTILYYIEL